MTSEQALMAAILDQPAEDLPREMYADYLEEHGDEADRQRSAFIRTQIELARLIGKGGPGTQCHSCGHTVGELSTSGPHYCVSCALFDVRFDPRHPHYQDKKPVPAADLRRRERELLEGPHASGLCYNHTAWAGKAASLVRVGNVRPYEFSRGFVSAVTCSWADWQAHAADLTWCWAPCERCHGEGYEYKQAKTDQHLRKWKCSTCHGSGRVPPTRECPKCLGDGDMRWAKCSCDGTGRVPILEPPAGAQPIQDVHLTTMPDVMIRWTHLADESSWPGIRFHLPRERQVPAPIIPDPRILIQGPL